MTFQKMNKVQEGSFNSQSYIDNYVMRGEFPEIHKTFGGVVKVFAGEHEPAMDIGTCIGIMSVYNVHNGRSFCVGIEGNEFDFNRCIVHPQCRYENFYVGRDTFPRIEGIIKKEGITLLTARRVISEVGFHEPEIVRELSALLAANGVKKVVLQGRTKVPKPTVPLYNTEKEAECFMKEYEVGAKFKDVWMLKLRG